MGAAPGVARGGELEVKSEVGRAIGGLAQRFESSAPTPWLACGSEIACSADDQAREFTGAAARSVISIPMTRGGAHSARSRSVSPPAFQHMVRRISAFAEELGRRAANAIDNARLIAKLRTRSKARDDE